MGILCEWRPTDPGLSSGCQGSPFITMFIYNIFIINIITGMSWSRTVDRRNLSNWLLGLLFGGSIVWFVSWLLNLLFGGSIVCLVGCLVCCLVGRLFGLLVGWLLDLLGWLLDLLAGCLITWLAA